MSGARISIIMPVYNCEKYLATAVDSIQKQTFSQWELILVEDGSTDRSGAICDDFAIGDPRIHVIHQKNGGAARARNVGIEAAHAELIMFVDSDDQLFPEALEDGWHLANAYGLDIVLGGLRVSPVDPSRKTRIACIELPDKEFQLYEGGQIEAVIRQILTGDPGKEAIELKNCLHSGPCARLFARKLIGDTRFPEGMILGEDVFFNAWVFQKARRVGITKHIWYHYRENTASVTKTLGRSAVDDLRKSLVWLEKSKELEGKYGKYWAEHIFSKLNTAITASFQENRKAAYQTLKMLLSEPVLRQTITKVDATALTPRRKILYWLIRWRATALLLCASSFYNHLRRS